MTEPEVDTNEATATTKPTAVKVTVNMPVRVWEAVDVMAAHYGVSRTEMFRRCLSAARWVFDVEQAGGEVQERAADGSVTRVKFPW